MCGVEPVFAGGNSGRGFVEKAALICLEKGTSQDICEVEIGTQAGGWLVSYLCN